MPTSALPRDFVDPRQDRLHVIDGLRGFALFGVVVANTVAALGFNPFFNPSLVASNHDRAAFSALTLFVNGRFVAMYSLLFGVGFGLMLARATTNDGGFVHFYLRRVAALFLIGVSNLVLFGGDVLHMYALLAVVLLSVRNASTRTLVILAVLSLLLPVLGRTAVDALGIQRSSGADPALLNRLQVEGPYLTLLQVRLTHLPRMWWVILNSTHLLGLFLTGLIVARHRLLQDSERYRALFIGVLTGGAVVTALGVVVEPAIQSWAASTPKPWRYLAMTVGSIRTIAQMFAYVAGFVLLWRSARIRGVLQRLAPSGRLALTNYLLVDIIVACGLFVAGGYGKVGPAAGCVIGVAIWVGMVLWSKWWIGRFRMGPVEWAWRSLAAGKRQVMRYFSAASRLDPVGGTVL